MTTSRDVGGQISFVQGSSGQSLEDMYVGAAANHTQDCHTHPANRRGESQESGSSQDRKKQKALNKINRWNDRHECYVDVEDEGTKNCLE